MTTQPASPQARHCDEPGAAGIGVQSVAQLIAAAVCGLHRLNDDFIRVNATLGDDGYIDVEVTRVDFTGEDVTERVLLYPTAPVPIPPRVQGRSVSERALSARPGRVDAGDLGEVI